MKESIKWDDSKDEIMDIVEAVEDNEELKIPIKCPICDTSNAHIYMHRWENDRGTVWAWCSNCKSCTHGSRLKLPNWWENADFINNSELTSHPIYLEPKVEMIDEYLRQLLIKENLGSNNNK